MSRPTHIDLKPCPFCDSEVRWCGTNEKNKKDIHDCHHIVCDYCGYNFDVHNDEAMEAETLDQLKVIVAKVWNRRYIRSVKFTHKG